MKAYDIVLLTESRFENPKHVDIYVQNILDDDMQLQIALEKKGFKVIRKDWESNDFEWSSTACIVFRTPWNYFDKFQKFSNWIKEVDHKSLLINPTETIFWNLDKHYLKDLEQKGVHTIPTIYIEKGKTNSLMDVYHNSSWEETILKPVISAGARHTYRINRNNVEEHDDILQKLITNEAMMLQPFQNNIVHQGEVSYMLFGGKFTHAILKQAKKGDFRVQDDFGGTIQKYVPNKKEIVFAENVVNACNQIPVYARVDVIHDNDDQLCLVELELIEPELWFRLYPKAADVFADEIIQYMKKNLS